VSREDEVTTIRVEKDTRANLEYFIRSRLSYDDVVSTLLTMVTGDKKLREQFIKLLEELNDKRARARG
jgi:hypothetical protein